MGMDLYAMEQWILQRHRETVCLAEERSRLVPAVGGLRPGEWVAEQLRRMADRLDGGAGVESQSPASSLRPSSS